MKWTQAQIINPAFLKTDEVPDNFDDISSLHYPVYRCLINHNSAKVTIECIF